MPSMMGSWDHHSSGSNSESRKMGKIDAESSINHFSHLHPLKLVSIQPSTSNRITCSICTKEARGLVYMCESCPCYCLHKPCSNMPQTLIHRVDQNHTLNLLPTPAYKEGAFQCNACGVRGTGFCYHCAECQIDLHTVCAFMRSSVKGSAHGHALELSFEPPYENKEFICDVCGEAGSNHWLYRCDSCGFDAHLKCAKGPILHHHQSAYSQIQQNQHLRINQEPQSNSLIKKRQHPQKLKSRNSVVQCARSNSWGADDQCSSSSSSPPPPPPSPSVLQQRLQAGGGLALPAEQAYHPFGSQPRRQLHYNNGNTAPVFPSGPSFLQVQPQATRNDAVQKVVQSVMEGLIEGAASQIGQAILQSALGN